MKSILMATDFSTRSDRAFDRALTLVRHHQSNLHVVHIVDEDLPEAIALNQKKAAEKNIRSQFASLPAELASILTSKVEIGKRSVEIIRQAREIHAELIILGIHNTAHEDFFHGTALEQIIRMGNVPVLVVLDDGSKPYQRVAVALDFSIHSRLATEAALTIAPEAEFHLIHAYNVPYSSFLYGLESLDKVKKEEETRMQQMVEKEMALSLRTLGVDMDKLNHVLKHGAVRQVIRQEVERIKPDLLAMGTHGRTGVTHAFLGSIAKNVLCNPPCDILIVKAW